MFIEMKNGLFDISDSVIVSIDTLHSADLYRQFGYVLECIDYKPDVEIPESALNDRYNDFWHSEECSWLIDGMVNQIESHLPDGYWFGGSEGDGACLGIWKIEPEFIETEQDWQNETTQYWFDYCGEQYCLADQNGDLTLLDYKSCPIEPGNDHIKDKLIPYYEQQLEV